MSRSEHFSLRSPDRRLSCIIIGSIPSYNDPLKVIALMLNNLCCPSGIRLPVFLPAAVKIFDNDILIPRRLPDAGEGQASLLRLIRRIFLHNRWVIHHNTHEAHADDDNPLFHTNHICRHADAVVLIGPQGIHEVLPDGQVLLRGGFRFLAEEKYVFYDGFDHVVASFWQKPRSLTALSISFSKILSHKPIQLPCNHLKLSVKV